MKTITCKLGDMRKAVEWVVYPSKESDEFLLIQSDRRICKFDKATGKGRLSASHNHPGFITLMMPGTTDVEVPEEIRKAALAAQPQKGDKIAGGVVVIG